MGRVRTLGSLCALGALIAGIASCGKKSSGVAPTTIHISPSVLSLEQSKFSGLSVTDSSGATIAPAQITWHASDPSALTIGLLGGVPTACAGVWDSLTAPTICSPGPAVAVQLSATANGATSPPVTVFVHSHIERLEATSVDTPAPPCLSSPSQEAGAGFANYKVVASNNGNDITSTIGPITWVAQNSTVVTLTTSGLGLLFNQVQATAKTPGQTQFFAQAGNATSTSVEFLTCPVRTITLATATGGNSLKFLKGSASQTITATVVDVAGLTLTNPPITWSSTNPTVASVTTMGVIAGLQTGGAAITASCFPPTCNVGVLPPSLAPPVYPSTGISVEVTGTPSSSTAFAASSGCWDRVMGPVLGCLSSIIPIPQSTNKPGSPVALPHTPTSMLISASGSQIYAGSCVPTTATGQPVCNGIAVVSSAGAVTTNNSVTGDVIGVSNNGNKAIVADSSTTPNQVFIYDQPSNAGTQLLLATTDHAKSAVFSPDGFQVYITTFQCTGSPCQASNEVPGAVYVYDAVNGLRRSSTAVGVTDVAFHPSGAFAYMAQAANAVTVLNTANNTVAKNPSGVLQVLATPGPPQFIRALHDWDDVAHDTHFAILNGPNASGLELVTATTPTTLTDLVCPLISAPPPLTICNSVGPVVDLNQGPLDAGQFLLSADGATAYVVPRNFSSVFSYNFASGQKGGIGLVGAQPPTTGGLTSDGAFLYVGSGDGLVHVLNTAFSSDTLQISPISSTDPATSMCSIPSATQPCNPDFVLVKP